MHILSYRSAKMLIPVVIILWWHDIANKNIKGLLRSCPYFEPQLWFYPHFLPLCVFTPIFSKRRFSLPLLHGQQVTVLKKLKHDEFALPNIAFLPLFQTPIVILPSLSSTLCFYAYFSKTNAPFTPIFNSVIYIRIKAIKI